MTELVSEEQFPAVEQESVGAKLARARQALDMSVADVAHALRLGIKQVEALEADDYEKLPGRTFVRGFLRNYARLVNMDPERLMVEYFPVPQETETQHIQAPSQQITFSEHHRKPWMKWLLGSIVAVALISWGILVWLGPESAKPVVTSKAVKPAPVLSAGMPAIVPAKPVELVAPPEKMAESASAPEEKTAPIEGPAPVADTGQRATLSLSFTGQAWVEVRDKSGKKIHSQNNQAGSQQTLQGEPPLSLVIGSAPNVKLTYKGQPVDLTAYTKADVARLTLE